MNSRYIPRESLTAWQRWELAALEAKPDVVQASDLPTAAELEEMRKLAEDEGYQAGLAAAQAEAERLRALLTSFDAALKSLEERLSGELLALALDIAQQVLRTALKANPELIGGAITDAMKSLADDYTSATLALNPSDAAIWYARIAAESGFGSVRVIEDAGIEPGGCRIQTPASEINATLPVRWERVVAALDCDRRWLDA
jgi:flagellar assembly protein FliH